jgi:nucleoside diphosphate kinase
MPGNGKKEGAAMKTKDKILIGGLGALTPIIMNLLVVDFRLLGNLTFIAFLGYLVRVIVLFYLGGLVAYLHKSEKNPIKLFELGIVAPALITALLNGGNVDVLKSSGDSARTAAVGLASEALAQPPQEGEVKTYQRTSQSPMQQFFQGLTGFTSKEVWFVIVGSYPTLEEARKEVQKINGQAKAFHAEVYASYGKKSGYDVVIGANLTYEAAQQLRQKAVETGLPRETMVWTFPP